MVDSANGYVHDVAACELLSPPTTYVVVTCMRARSASGTSALTTRGMMGGHRECSDRIASEKGHVYTDGTVSDPAQQGELHSFLARRRSAQAY